MHKLRLKRLAFSNVLSYGGNVNEVIFNNGITWIKGPNGVGKSAILEALTFALFSTPFRSITKGELRNTANKGKLDVELEFEREDNKGVVEHRVKRSMTKSSTKSEYYEAGDETPKPAGYSQKIFEDEVLGFNKSIFENVISLNTIETVSFIDMEPLKKRKLIESMLTLQIDKFKDLNKKSLKLAQTKLESAKSDVIKYENDLSELKGMLVKLESEKMDDIEELNEQIGEHKNAIKQYELEKEDKQNEYKSIVDKGKIIQAEIDSKPDYTDMINTRQVAINLLTQIESITPKRKEKYNISKDKKILLQEASRSRLSEVDMTVYNGYKDELSELNTLKIEKQTSYTSNERNQSSIEKKAKELTVGVPCPTCGKPSTEDEIESVKKEYRVQWTELKKAMTLDKNELEKCNSRIEELDTLIAELDKQISSYNEAEYAYTNAKKDSDVAQEIYMEVNDEYIDTMNNLGDTGFSDKTIDELNSDINDINENKKEVDNLTAELNELRSDIKSINTSIKSLDTNIENENTRIASIESKIAKKQAKEENDGIGMLEKKIKGAKSDFETAKKRVSKYSDEISITKYIEGMYDDSGIKQIVLGIFVPNLNKAIAYNLNLFNLPFNLEFNHDMEYRFESGYGMSPSYKALSQGQKRRLNFAISIAFRDFVTSIADFDINLLFLDEVLDISTDDEALESMIQLLKLKAPEIGGTYLISHRSEQFSDYFDHTIEVTNDGRYSFLEMKELPKTSNY